MSRRKAGEQHVSHDRWLVSYADFITLLFAFFVVLYASAEMDKKKVVQLSAAIEGAFQEMGVFAKSVPADANGGKQPILPPAPPPAASEGAHPAYGQEASASEGIDANALQHELESVLGSEIKQHEIEIRVTPEGLTVSLREVGFFNSGRARLLPNSLPKLARIAKILNAHGFDIRVEGHTDDIPIDTAEFQSNWELSTARATNVVTLLVESYHLDPLRVSVAGYGPYRPIASNATAQGRKMNRRVDLVITSRAKAASPVGKAFR